MSFILPYSHTKLYNIKYAIYPSLQPHKKIHHKICYVLFPTAAPKFSPQNMPCILPYSHTTTFTTQIAMYSS